MRRTNALILVGTTAAFALIAGAANAVTLGQINDFEDGTTQGWGIAAGGMAPAGMVPNTPTNVDSTTLTGKALQLDASGVQGPGGRLTSFNFFAGWEGNYIAEGISGIEMDLYNPNDQAVAMRLFLGSVAFDSMGAPVGLPGAYYSAAPIMVGPNSTLTDALFSILEGDLVDVVGGQSYAETLADIAFIRLFHNPNGGTVAFGMGDLAPLFSGSLQVDNIEALGAPFSDDGGSVIPEPSTAVLLAMGLSGLAMRRKHRAL